MHRDLSMKTSWFSPKLLEALKNFDSPLLIISDWELSRVTKISERLIIRRIEFLRNKLKFEPNQILVVFSNILELKNFNGAKTINQILFSWSQKYKLSPSFLISTERIRNNFFNSLDIENYKAFIISAPFEDSLIVNELFSRIKKNNNIFWLDNGQKLLKKHLDFFDSLFDVYRIGQTSFQYGTIFLKTSERIQKESISKTQNKKITLTLREDKFTLDYELKKELEEDNCLLFSENFDILRRLTQERIDNFSKKFKRNLIISREKNLKIEEKELLIDPIYLSTKDYLSEVIKSVIIFADIEKNLENLITQSFERNVRIFVATKRQEDVLIIFKEKCPNFNFLDFEFKSTGIVKKNTQKCLSIDPEITKVFKIKIDEKTKKYIQQGNCVVFSRNPEILKTITKERIESFSKDSSKLLLISYSSNWNKNENVTLISPRALTAYLWSEKNFDSIVITDIDENVKNFTIECLKKNKKFFLILKEEDPELLQSLNDFCDKFFYLNFNSGLLGKAKKFERLLLSVDTKSKNLENLNFLDEIQKTNEFLVRKQPEIVKEKSITPNAVSSTLDIFDSNIKKEIQEQNQNIFEEFNTPLIVFSKNEEISRELALKRVDFLKNKLGFSSNQIILCFKFLYHEDNSIDVDFFWSICDELCNGDLSLMKNDLKRKAIFKNANFENNYKAFVIISPLDCHIALKELISRVVNLGNIIWFVFGEDSEEKELLLNRELLSGFSKYKARHSNNGQSIIVDRILEKKTNKSNDTLFDEEQEVDFVLAKQPKIINDEEDGLFDQSVVVKITDEEDDGEKEDIGGGLDFD